MLACCPVADSELTHRADKRIAAESLFDVFLPDSIQNGDTCCVRNHAIVAVNQYECISQALGSRFQNSVKICFCIKLTQQFFVKRMLLMRTQQCMHSIERPEEHTRLQKRAAYKLGKLDRGGRCFQHAEGRECPLLQLFFIAKIKDIRRKLGLPILEE